MKWGDKLSIVGEITKLPGKIAGEISKLRETVQSWGTTTGSLFNAYKLKSEIVNYKLARNLYDNTEDEYKLGAWAAKPVINTIVGFMGVPAFVIEDEDAQAVLDDFQSQIASLQQQVHLSALRDADCWVWLTLEESEATKELYPETGKFRLVFNIIPPDMIAHNKLRRDPITGEIIEYVLEAASEWIDERGNRRKCIVQERISKEKRVTSVEGDNPGIETGEFPSKWGFVPIVQFSNEKNPGATYGKSELESIEPFMKAYHDVMLHAIQGSKLHSTPRLKLKLKNVARFLLNNFGITDPEKFVREGGRINLTGSELLIFEDGEDAEFIEVMSAIGDAKALLKLLFFCIVDVSETPEFAFGTHTPSSQASVKEQMPVLVKKVLRKREHFADNWKLLARMALTMHSMSGGKKFSTHAVDLVWDEVDPRDEKEVAAMLEVLIRGLSMAITNQLMSHEAAVTFLAQYVETMNDYKSDDPEVVGEKDRIIQDGLRRSQLEDAELAEDELKMIEQVLAEVSKNKKRDGDW